MATTTMPKSAGAEWARHWPLIAATTAGMSLAGVLSSVFGVMLAPLEEEFGWSRAQISSGPAVVSMVGFVLATPAGYLIDRLGTRRCGILVVLLSCISIASMALVGNQLWQWWAAWSLFGICAGFTSTVWLAPVAATFHAGRGLAIAVTFAGVGVSMAVAPIIAEWFVQNHGWRAGFLALSAIWFVLTMPLVLAFVPKLPIAGDSEPDAAARVQQTGLTPRQGFASRALYMLFLASLFAMMTGVALMLNLVPVLTFTGLARTDAVAIAGSIGVASILGRFVGGALMDRYDVRWLAVGACVFSLILPLLLLTLPGHFWPSMAGVIGYGLTGGMTINAIVYLTSTHLGARSFGLFYGVISITTTLAQGIGPLIANHIYDLTHSYIYVIWATIPGFVGAALLFALLGPAPDLSKPAPA